MLATAAGCGVACPWHHEGAPPVRVVFAKHMLSYEAVVLLLTKQVFVYAINPDNGSPMRNNIEQMSEHFVNINPLSSVRMEGILTSTPCLR